MRIRLFYARIDISKFFADKKYGDKRKSFLAANAFKETAIVNLEKQGIHATRSVKTCHVMPGKRNKSGIAGVSRYVKKRNGAQRNYAYWRATFYPEPYKAIQKMFAVNLYGEEKAFELAKAFREKGLLIAKRRKKL